ncbi:MAG: cob(I)yrinic acid a,c-diamide adenosyltransferase [Candidatus Kerfeldbacteria bacterium]
MAKRVGATLHPMNRGLTIAYIGNGKGKTSAAIGAAVRAAGYGWKVLYFQFFKSLKWPSGERLALHRLGVDVRVRGEGFVGILGDRKPRSIHRRAAIRALAEAKRLILTGAYQLVVLDEAISCLEQKLLTPAALISVLDARKKSARGRRVHVLMTGHNRYPALLSRCDLVTEMKMVKHPYYKGILAVKGIDF